MISNLRSQLAERRIVRQRSRKLADELASYRTPAERHELDAILGRHSDQQIAQLESILNRQAEIRIPHL